jgi:membrane glycosyltransferase
VSVDEGSRGSASTWQQSPGRLFRRRFLFSAAVGLTIAALTALLVAILGRKGPLDGIDGLLVGAFIVNVTWLALGVWNSLIGMVLLHGPADRLERISPLMDDEAGGCPLTGRVAVAMTIRNETAGEVFARLKTLKGSLDATGAGGMFGYYVLSDSSTPEAADAEEREFATWRAELADPGQVTYRRRATNEGFKPGNLRDFCRRWGGDYDFLVLLDADSLMTGDAVLRLIDAMAKHPRLGIVQSLIVGILSPSFFARLFEFGHRHGLRCAIAGAAWWQGDRCQFWGHNAVIRLKPFISHCEMPFLPGKGPFSGHIICHDQIEASFMHRAGYDVRVYPREGGSYEGIPPTLLDFMKRNHRWCQGNLKNLKVMGAPGLAAIDRFHLGVVAQRFIAWPALVLFVMAAAAQVRAWPAGIAFPSAAALALYALWLAMVWFPKVAGVADAFLTAPAAYGGRARLAAGAVVELLFTLMLIPVTAVGATQFMVGLLFGRTVVWDQQARDGYRLSWRGALAGLWLPTVLGVALLAVLAAADRGAVVWFAPVWLALVLAVPFAVLTSSPTVDAWAKRRGLCLIPEEIDKPAVIGEFLRLTEGGGR